MACSLFKARATYCAVRSRRLALRLSLDVMRFLYVLSIYCYLLYLLSHSKIAHTQGCQERAHARTRCRLLGFALDHRGWADRARARGRGVALCGWRALHFGASGPRARRAFTSVILARTIIYNYWLGLRNTAF